MHSGTNTAKRKVDAELIPFVLLSNVGINLVTEVGIIFQSNGPTPTHKCSVRLETYLDNTFCKLYALLNLCSLLLIYQTSKNVSHFMPSYAECII